MIYENPNPVNLTAFLEMNSFQAAVEVWRYCDLASSGFANSNGFKALLNYPDNFKFDLVMFDYTCGPFLLGFVHKFRYPPMMGMTALSVPPYTYDYIGGHSRHAYVVHYFTTLDPNKLGFFERLHNYASALWDDL